MLLLAINSNKDDFIAVIKL